MKGSNKQFARFLNSECNDEYLQPLDNNHDQLDRQFKSNNESHNPQQKDNATQKGSTTFQPDPKVVKTALNKDLIRDLIAQLGKDAHNCLENVKVLEFIKSSQVLDAYKDFSTKFQTVPVLFFSMVPYETVYLWQINRLCPFKKATQLVLDSNSLVTEVLCHMSFMLLAKITAEEGEELIDAKMLGDNMLYVRLKQEQGQIAIKFYDVTSFVHTTRVNPFRQEVLANDLYTYKIVINDNKNNEASNSLIVSLWKKNSTEEELLRKRIVEWPCSFDGRTTDFNEIFRVDSGAILIVDEYTGTIVALKDTELSVVSSNWGNIREVQQSNTNLYMIADSNNCYNIAFDKFPNFEVQSAPTNGFSFPTNWQQEINEWKKSFNQAEQTLEYLLYTYDFIQYSEYSLYVYDVPNSLINTELMKQAPTEAADEEKKEETIIKKIEKMNKNTKNEQAGLEGKNEMLKEIRTEIATKLKEVHKYKEGQQQEQNKQNKQNTEEPEKPEGVSKETLELYSQIKSEKKKMENEREKEKAQRKKGRSNKNEW